MLLLNAVSITQRISAIFNLLYYRTEMHLFDDWKRFWFKLLFRCDNRIRFTKGEKSMFLLSNWLLLICYINVILRAEEVPTHEIITYSDDFFSAMRASSRENNKCVTVIISMQ